MESCRVLPFSTSSSIFISSSSSSSFFFFVFLFIILPSCYCQDGISQEQALLDMKSAFKDPNNELYSWDASTQINCCLWQGVTCDNKTFAVVQLDLSNLCLSGEISPSIGMLNSLISVNLSHNRIVGQIPDEIGFCSSLEQLDLSYNEIEGNIPFSLSKLKVLQSFIMKNNRLAGSIPSTLSQLPSLNMLDLADNQLTGEIPSVIYWSEVLQYIGLRNNFLSGSLSPDIWRLTSLIYFDVAGNNLTGEIPATIGNCTSLQVLDLASNDFTGSIPYNIGFLQVATLALQGNKLTGKIPTVIGLMQALAVLDLSYNQLSGSIPIILGNLTFTRFLYLHGNDLTGSIPPELGNMTQLEYLQLYDNNLTGKIPSEFGQLQNLWELNLSDNQLDGPIPVNLSFCISMTAFSAYNNLLTGMIPTVLQDIRNLAKINLSNNRLQGNIPEELGHIRQLEKLDLSDNYLSGIVPSTIGNLEHLLELDLHNNQLSGTITVEFGNLRDIYKMDLSYNHLSGPIPQELGELQDLSTLSLNNNELSGVIPVELANCLSLATLNLSYNNLSGEIPNIKNFTRFSAASFLGNKALCGKKLGIVCASYDESTTGVKTKHLVIGLGLAGAITVLALLAWIWKYNYQRSEKFGSKAAGKPLQGAPRIVILNMDLSGHSYEDIMRLTDNLSQRYAIGFGASSTVYKCILKSGKPLAVKKLYHNYQQSTREFEAELDTVGRIKHRNLVSLQGYSLSPQGNLLFYEFMENGSLWDLLHGVKKMKLDWDMRLSIALGAAKGLAYLHHDCNPRIVHRDVKSSNILLDQSFEAHLTDFGIAKSISLTKAHTSTLVMGTIGYIDPEYARTSRLNEKSDIYSFGIVLLELMTGRRAVDDETNLHQWVLIKHEADSLAETVDPILKDTGSDTAAINKVLQLALLCTKKQPVARPTMNDVVKVLLSLFPVSVPKPFIPTRPAFHYAKYLDEYGNNKSKDDLIASGSTSPGHLFEKFGEVISQNTV